MKHIKVYIVTWKRNDVLDDLLHDLFERTTFKDYDNCEVNIINNHSGLEVNDKFKDKVKIHLVLLFLQKITAKVMKKVN